MLAGLYLTKFLHDVARSCLNLLKSELRYHNPFQNGKVTNESKQADCADFDSIGCHGSKATAVERTEKEGQISNLQSNTYHMVKI